MHRRAHGWLAHRLMKRRKLPIIAAPEFEVSEDGGVRKHHQTDDPRVGMFNLSDEILADRALTEALMSLMTVMESWRHESGRGMSYIAMSPLFQPIQAAPRQTVEIPTYRIEFDHPRKPLADREAAKECIRVGRFGLGFRAVRQNIVRVPLLSIKVQAHQTKH